jgi:hypothetical protein
MHVCVCVCMYACVYIAKYTLPQTHSPYVHRETHRAHHSHGHLDHESPLNDKSPVGTVCTHPDKVLKEDARACVLRAHTGGHLLAILITIHVYFTHVYICIYVCVHIYT